MSARPAWLEPIPSEGAPAGRPDELHGERLDRADASSEPERNSGLRLDLAGPASHRLRHAADESEMTGLLGDRRNERLCRAEKMGGRE